MSREVLRAILKGDVAKIDVLMQQGNDAMEVTEKERWNYLHRAMLSPSMPPSREIVDHLISLGVDVNAIDVYGNAPLHYAARLKRPDLIQSLVMAGANVNVVNQEGVSPLRQLLLEKPYNHECFRLLLESGADVQQKVNDEASVKELASMVASDDVELMTLLNR